MASSGIPARRVQRYGLLIAWAIIVAPLCHADDWPEWRGPRRDGVSHEKSLLTDWPPDRAPAAAWRVDVGKGHSAVSVSRGRAFTMGWDGTNDTVFCFDAVTGKRLWRYSYPCKSIQQWPGPRSTPTVAGDRVYTLSQHGLLHALDAATGDMVWQKQLSETYNPDVDYGFAWSPLVEGDLVILGGGERGLALRAKDGQFAWGNDGKAGTCASPVRCDIDGKRVVVLVSNDRRESVRIVGVEPVNGRELWRSAPWPEKWGAACIDPIVRDNAIFLTTAEQHAECGRFLITPAGLEKGWANRKLSCYTGSCVLVKDHLFGVTKVGLLRCLDWSTGKERWSERGFGNHGAITAVGDTLIVQASDSGEIVVVDANGSEYQEVRRLKTFAAAPETFTAPVFANGRLYCRSYRGEVVCFAVRTAAP